MVDTLDALTGDDFFAMVHWLRHQRVSSRKFRLYACACCRHIWHLIGDERSRRIVTVAERFADGLATRKELAAARASSPGRATAGAPEAAIQAVLNTAHASGYVAAEGASLSALKAAVSVGNPRLAEQHVLADLLRDIVRHPWLGAPPIDPAWLAWNGGTVTKLARAIYEDRRFENLPILTDVLVEAGCDNPVLLEHGRRAAGHVRGCWMVDAILSLS